MGDIADYVMTEVVVENDGYVLYSALDSRNVKVLLKVTRADATPDHLSALSSDFLAARHCEVPAIPKPIRFDTMVTGGTFQVREHVPGRPLSRWLERRAFRPSEGEAMQIARSLLAALDPLHARGFIHCDLNPQTLLYDPAGRSIYFADCAATRGYGAVTRRRAGYTTPYLAPEMILDDVENVDARADLYSVGVIAYELATGQLPPEDGFEATSGVPLPEPFAKVLARLLRRDRERRYPTAAAAERALSNAVAEWSGHSSETDHGAGIDDTAPAVRLPDGLLGRHAVRRALADALVDAGNGKPTLVLLSGEGGSGKSTILADLKRSAIGSNALVLIGGWGLFDRAIPFRGLFPLCEQITEWLSTLPREERNKRVEKIKAALGTSCGVITEAFPVLESVLGMHPRPPATGTIERQNRLTFCFSTLLVGLGSPERPVVVLLEDLHWADGASLFMVERLPGQPASHHLLTVATVRTGLDGADEAFVAELEAMSRERGQTVHRLPVTPFEPSDTESFLGGALGLPPSATTTLASVLGEMSLGNPLALRELVAEVRAQGLLSFDATGERWVWHVDAIRQRQMPEDLAQIFASRISSLRVEALDVLQAAACIGGPFEIDDIVDLLQRTEREIDDALALCEKQGFVTERVGSAGKSHRRHFVFRHERIQSAAYLSIPAPIQERFHATRGAAKLAEHGATGSSETLFEALTHLNRSHGLRGGGEDLALAKHNIRGAVLAKEATAYDAAATLLQNADLQLPRDPWRWDPELAFDSALLRAECEHLCKRTARAAEIYAELLNRVSNPEQRITVLMARTQMLTNVGRFSETVADGIASLKLLGVELAADPSSARVMFPMLRLLALHSRLPTERNKVALTQLDPTDSRIMACLAELWGPAFWVSQNLTGLVVFAMVRHSLLRGNTPASSIAYCSYGVFLAQALKRNQLGKQICGVGVAIAEKAEHPVYLGRARFMYESFFGPYERRLQDAPNAFREIASGLLRAGDYSYAGAAANMFLYYVAVVGTPLADFPAHVRDIVGVARQTDQSRTLLTVEILQRWIAILDGREAYATPNFIKDLNTEGGRGSENERGVFHLFEISLLYFLEDYRAADPHIEFMPGNRMLGGYFAGYYAFFTALIVARQRVASARQWQRKFRRLRGLLERESALYPQNYRHKALLLAAIEADFSGKGDAPRLFEQAIADANENGFLPNAAIAAELLAEHLERRGQIADAERQLRAARLWYQQWGCVTKVDAIDRRLRRSPNTDRPPSQAVSDNDAVWPRQAGAVLEATRALSGETEPARLAERLIGALLEHTGASRVVLLIREDAELSVVCERRKASPTSERPSSKRDLPESVVNYVDRLGRALRLKASVEHDLFGRDPYMTARPGAALLCVPLVNMRQKIGVLFLEKDPPDDLRQSDLVTAEILAAQAAATLSNAREYNERLAALQNQMHPHFLFNALSGIAELTATEPPRAERAIVRLATLYRNILTTSQRRAISLSQELELVHSYLSLEKLRFGERLSYRFDLPEPMPGVLIPPLILQPIVENSVNHGIALRPDGGTVSIAVSVESQRVHVRVSDDGAGWKTSAGQGTGFGLSGTRRRLELFFGSDIELAIKATPGVTVDLFFPARLEDREA